MAKPLPPNEPSVHAGTKTAAEAIAKLGDDVNVRLAEPQPPQQQQQKGRLAKGSPEAKAEMAKLRAKKRK